MEVAPAVAEDDQTVDSTTPPTRDKLWLNDGCGPLNAMTNEFVRFKWLLGVARLR